MRKPMLALNLVASCAALLCAANAVAQPAPPSAPRENMFDRLDANNDGVLTRQEAQDARARMFATLDGNHDGFLTRQEMLDGRQRLRDHAPVAGPRSGPPRLPEHNMVRSADTNNDGAVSRQEFQAFANQRAAERDAARTRRQDEMFARMDTDNNGSLSQAELDAARQHMQSRREIRRDRRELRHDRRELRQDQREDAWQRMDSNNDQRVSRAEWMAMPDRMFDRADANNDGRVTREEAAGAWQRGIRGNRLRR